jgi:hypothetical protein
MTYMTDKIKIVTFTKDKNGVSTKVIGSEISARIKDNCRLVINNQGQEKVGFATIMIDRLNNTVKYGDKVIITYWKDEIYTSNKEFVILKYDYLGGFTNEVIKIEI